MESTPPLLVRLSSSLLSKPFPVLAKRLQRQHGVSSSIAERWLTRYALHPQEKRFVLALWARKRNLWIYRCDQRAFCGDFALVDMSSPELARRSCWLLELKLNQDLRTGGGGAGNQFHRAEAVGPTLRDVHGVVALQQPTLLAGDAQSVLHSLGVTACWMD